MPQEDIPNDMSDSDRYFVENIYFLCCVKKKHSQARVLIFTTWLSQAANEEQTSVLLLILKVLCHLPLHKASPELQSVNGLRFYRISDISNRAKGLLSRWKKLFAKIQAMKKQNRKSSQIDSQSQLLLKQRQNLIIPNQFFGT